METLNLRMSSLLSMINHVPKDRLDDVTKLLWQAYGAGEIGDRDAAMLSAAIERRRGSTPWQRADMESPFGDPPPRHKPFIR